MRFTLTPRSLSPIPFVVWAVEGVLWDADLLTSGIRALGGVIVFCMLSFSVFQSIVLLFWISFCLQEWDFFLFNRNFCYFVVFFFCLAVLTVFLFWAVPGFESVLLLAVVVDLRGVLAL